MEGMGEAIYFHISTRFSPAHSIPHSLSFPRSLLPSLSSLSRQQSEVAFSPVPKRELLASLHPPKSDWLLEGPHQRTPTRALSAYGLRQSLGRYLKLLTNSHRHTLTHSLFFFFNLLSFSLTYTVIHTNPPSSLLESSWRLFLFVLLQCYTKLLYFFFSVIQTTVMFVVLSQ